MQARQGESSAMGCLVDGQATALLSLTAGRFGPLPEAARRRIETADADMLEQFLHGLLDATSLQMLLGLAA